MSKLEELIKEFCPNGVEYVKIGSVVNYEQPSKYLVKKADYKEEYSTPVLTAGQTFILGYTNEMNGIYNASKDSPVIIFDDFTGALKWVDFPFKVKSSAIKFLKANEKIAMLRYIFHVMGNINLTSTEHKRLWIGIYSELQIPLPALPVQREIVRILDSFTLYSAELTTKLTAELTVRRKQYEFYRDKLLNFTCNTIQTKIGQVCNVFTGGEPPVEHIKGDVPTVEYKYPIWGNGKDIYGYSKTFQIGQDAVVISSIGANTGAVYFRKANFTPIIRLKVLTPKNNDVNIRYLFYHLSNKKIESKSSSVPNMNSNEIKQLSIEIPPIDVQERIVKVLDNFDAICSDLGIGLPAEIEKRQKQYEYYRDKLLTFEGKNNNGEK